MARWRKLGVIAGAGALPHRIASAATARGEAVHVIGLAGLADGSLDVFENDRCGIAEAGKIIRKLKEAGCDAVTLAGVVKRPDFSKLAPDWRGAAILPRVIAAAARGDGALLSVLVEEFEKEGFLVVGAEETMSELRAPAGPFGVLTPDEAARADLRKAAALIKALGPFDCGQGAVVANGLVLAVEAAGGTDAMLDQCARLPAALRGGDGAHGVLVKRPKPGQELRVDLPTIGVTTVRGVSAAGLAGIAVEAGAALVIDAEETREAADALGVFVYGFTDADLETP